MQHTRDARFAEVAATLGYSFEGEIRIGGNYVSVVRHDALLHVSGQIPRVGNEVVVVGRVGDDVTLADAQLAAKVCALRALALLRQALGTLDNVARILRISVYVRSAPDFTRQSEVADGASDVLHAVLGEAGRHARTSVGVYQLPKGAAVELDLVAAAA